MSDSLDWHIGLFVFHSIESNSLWGPWNDVEFVVLLPQPLECWNFRYVPPHLAGTHILYSLVI